MLDLFVEFRFQLFHMKALFYFKVPLTPKFFLLLKKSTSFPDFISEKIISIDKILAFLQAFEHAISMFTTAQSGIWVGLLVTSLREPSWNRSRDFRLRLEGCQTFLGYLWFMFYRNRARFLRKRTVSSSITIWSLATIWTTAMYIYFFPFRSAGRQRRLPRRNFCQDQDQQFAGPFGLSRYK